VNKKIGIQTWGSDGDILPFIALAIGLRRSGHKVTVVYTSIDNKDYSSLAASHDISIVKAHERFDEDGKEMFSETVNTRDPLKQLALVLDKYFVPAIDEMYSAAKTLCGESDLVIGHGIHYPLATAAEKTERPRISLVLCPMMIETEHVSPLDVNLGRWLNSLLWKAGDRLARRKIYGAADILRRREGLLPFANLQEDLYVTKKLTLIATSAVLCPRQPDWGEHIQVCGFLNPPGSDHTWKMPSDLEGFIEGGKPPVYFTFGSCTQFDPEQTTRLFVEAAQKAGVRAIIQSNWEAGFLPENPPDVYRVSSIPHGHIFPHCSAIVHHGGSGTSQSALKAGIPSVVVAHAYDQPYWGRKLKQLGVAGRVLHRRNTTSDVLAERIRSVLDSPQMAANAREAKQVMSKENGVDTAAALINQLLFSRVWPAMRSSELAATVARVQ